MTALDIIVLSLVGLGAFLGFRRGFVAEALSLAAWAAGILAVKFGHEPARDLLAGFMSSSSGASALAVVLLFGIAFIGMKMLADSLGRRTRESLLGPFDRMLGLGFGVLKGLLGATLLFMAASFFSDMTRADGEDRPEWMTGARSYPLLRATSNALLDLVEQRRRRDPAVQS